MKSGADIVLELQSEASSSSVAVSDLLQKAFLVARKLKIIDQEPWIQSEFNGYLEINGNYDLIPPYRFLKSKLDYEKTSSGDTVFYDLYSLGINPSDPHENTEKYPCHVSVPEIERMLEGEAKNNFVHIPCQPDVEKHYREDVKLPPSFPIVLTVQASHLRGILNDVRNRIRDWAWKLDKNGAGEPPKSSKQRSPVTEKEAADICDCSSRTIRNWEAGIHTPKNPAWPGLHSVTAIKAFAVTRKSDRQSKQAIRNMTHGDMDKLPNRAVRR